MSSVVARTHGFRRLVATATLALIAATGVTAATATTASALTAPPEPPPPWSPPPDASFAWTDVKMQVDNGTVGVLDEGDVVRYTYTATVFATSPSALGSFWFASYDYPLQESGLAIAPGASQSFSWDVRITAPMLDALGSGPNLSGARIALWAPGLSFSGMTTIGAPPVLYTAPSPVAVSTSFNMTEVNGFEANKLVEGDQVHYVTHVTNTSRATLTLTGTGYATPCAAVPLPGGESMDFVGTDVGVTYADMVAGGVSFADASVSWSVDSLSGTVPAPVGTAPTEAIYMWFTSDVATAVHTSAGAAVTMGSAVAGNHIDYTFQLSNTGNVVFNYVYLQRNWRAPGVGGTARGPVAALVQGASLPSGGLHPELITSNGGRWPAYPLVQADIDRGYVDLAFTTAAAPSRAVFDRAPGTYQQTFTKRVFLKNFTTNANLKFTEGQLNDTNGDGIGQEGETIAYGVRFKNNADQPLKIDAAGEVSGWYLPAPLSGPFNGVTLNANDVVDQQWDYTITAADVARGEVEARVFTDYHGTIDSAADSRTNSSAKIPTGIYVAPASTLDTAATYDDTNLDGFPSIGETVHVTVTVTNAGSYPLTGLTVADAAGSDVTGLLPVFPTDVAGLGSASEGFDYVLTAADFARGSLTYSTEMTATGLPTTASSTSVNLTGIKFQAYETDLDAMAAGGIQVCESDGTPTDTITLLSTILVTPGSTCAYSGLPYGYRIVGFSTPMLLGTNAFSVTVPVALHVGAHRLALYAPNGTLVGWKDVTAKDPYVAPASTLDTAATYDDTNLDGFPSIGEKVHVTVTVTNSGNYPLTGLTVADAAGSNVTGLLPVFPTDVAGLGSASEGFDYVLTAADFARGSLIYSTEMTATGLPTTASSTSVNLTGIKFQAYATDLSAMAAGGIQVCESDGTPTDTVTLLSTILVTPGSTCTYSGLPYGYRIVGFSTPMLLGTNAFSVTVPVALHVGAHRLALYAPNGTLVGWKDVTAKTPTDIYVAPASTLDTAATYDDTNLDGFPSIGEKVHVTVTVTNLGNYPLTGLTVTDAAGSDVTGLLPVFATNVAGPGSAVEGFDYVLTAADFARGSLTYSTEMTATGLPTTASSTSVNLTGIKFQAYETDLDAMDAGGIQVCESNGTPTDTITLLSTILVTPGSTCTYSVLPYGYRVVGFSTPVLMGTNAFSVTVPVALHVGAHRLALYAPNGTLVGWKAVTAKDPIALAGPDTGVALASTGANGVALASTGANGDEVVGLGGDAVLFVLLGTAFMVADSRRRKHEGR